LRWGGKRTEIDDKIIAGRNQIFLRKIEKSEGISTILALLEWGKSAFDPGRAHRRSPREGKDIIITYNKSSQRRPKLIEEKERRGKNQFHKRDTNKLSSQE